MIYQGQVVIMWCSCLKALIQHITDRINILLENFKIKCAMMHINLYEKLNSKKIQTHHCNKKGLLRESHVEPPRNGL